MWCDDVGTDVLRRRHVAGVSHFLSNHPQLLEVDQAVDLGVVAQVNEGQILLHNRKERDLKEGHSQGHSQGDRE